MTVRLWFGQTVQTGLLRQHYRAAPEMRAGETRVAGANATAILMQIQVQEDLFGDAVHALEKWRLTVMRLHWLKRRERKSCIKCSN